MNEIRARYIQDEREDARKEGIKEGEIKGEIKCFRIKPIIKLSIIEYISKNFVIETNFLYSI